jgi:hypothetical protein
VNAWLDLLDWRDRMRRRLYPYAPLLGATIIAALLLLGLSCVGPVDEREHNIVTGARRALVAPVPTVEPTPLGAPVGTRIDGGAA